MADSTFEKEFLEAHNAYRQRHGASPLTISKDLCRSAQKWAEHLLSRKSMQHSQGDYGENLYYAWSSASKQPKGKEAVDSWYNEIKDYNFRRPGFQSSTGHFTQVVWKGSEKLGVGLATDGNTVFVVGQYLPAGNISNPGYFEKNVLPAGSSVERRDNENAQSGGNDHRSLPSKQAGNDHNSSSVTESSFESEFLEAHNAYRQRHGASPLTISKDLCRSAQKWAEHLLSRKSMQHSQGDYGENLFYAWSSASKQPKGKEAVDNWYNEIKDYNFRRPGFQSGTGHFTQVVWKGSEQLGVGLATDGNTVFVVGQYLPAGNITNPGYFEKNVLPAGSSVESHDDTDAQSGGNDRHTLPSRQTGSDHNSSSVTESSFESEFLEAHNAYRQRHGASPLTISKDLCRSAQKWAEHLLSRKSMQHSQGDYGENLFYAWSSASKQPKGKEAVDSWYNEIKDYNFRRPGFQSSTGHFTQVVWKGSEKLGVGLATDGNTVFVVGQYLPAGNISNPGYFEKNVLPAGSPVKTCEDAAQPEEKDQHKLPSRQTGSDHNSSSVTSTKSSFESEFLEAHNAYRQRHGASDLTISKDLCRSAQKWAEYLLSSKKMQHSMADYGENLYYTWSSVPKQLKGKEAVDSWYNEIKDYNFRRPGFQSSTGHFTQVVWKGSEKLGVGLATDGNTTFVVGQYLPAGNVSNPGYFEKNVLPAGSPVEKRDNADATSGADDWDRSDSNSSSLAGAGGGKNPEFSVSAVDAMNGYRRQHGAKPLSLSPSLCEEAQEWADYLVKSNMVRNHGKGHGESLWYQHGSSAATPKGEDVVKSWYNENSKYNFSYPGFQNGTGNFTQMVWRSSEKVGVAIATNGSGLFISVAFFEPTGNINSRSHFQDNVKAKS